MNNNTVFKAASTKEVAKRQKLYPSVWEGIELPGIAAVLSSLVLDQVSPAQSLESTKSTVFYVDVVKRGWNWKYIRSRITYYWAKWTGRIMH